MNAIDQRRTFSLPITTSLDHRIGPAIDVASLRPPSSAFVALGGREAVARLVDGLYDRIEADRLLRPAFGHDLTNERANQKLFFEVWLGGSSAYFDRLSWPGLAARHAAISISPEMAKRWLGHFLESLADVAPNPDVAPQIAPMIVRLAKSLVNREQEPEPGAALRRRCSGTDVAAFTRLIQRDDADGIAAAAAERPLALQLHGPLLLLIASVRGKSAAADALMKLGVDPNMPEMLPGDEASVQGLRRLRITPLCAAIARRRTAVVALLLTNGARYDIFTAAFVGDAVAVRELLDDAPHLADATDPACDFAEITPLVHAVFGHRIDVARLLLERGAIVGPNSARLVRAAADAGDVPLLELLLDYGASAAAIGPGAWVTHDAVADRLIAAGADVNQPPGKWIGICCTGNSGHKENAALARGLLRCGADVAARYKGKTALHCASRAGFAQIIDALIAHGASVNALDDAGRTPLDYLDGAGRSIDVEPVRQLLIAASARRTE